MAEHGRKRSWQELAPLDRGGMAEALAGFPVQCREGLALGEGVPLDGLAGFSRVVALGMGGSGIAGALLTTLLPVEVVLVRDYTLPGWIGEESLAITLSYSGDTEETLSAFDEARTRTKRAVAVTSGGELGARCSANGIPWIRIPPGHQPRAALGYRLFPLLGLFRRLGLIPDLGEALAILDELARELAPGGEENEAQRLAQRLAGRVPLAYGAGPTAPVAVRWKTQVNENAKAPAFWAELPELCHNEVVGYELMGRLLPQGTVVFLRSRHDHPRVARRIAILEEILTKRGLDWIEVSGRGEGLPAELLSLLYLGDWTSYYLALLGGVDPTPVAIIRDLKDRLSR